MDYPILLAYVYPPSWVYLIAMVSSFVKNNLCLRKLIDSEYYLFSLFKGIYIFFIRGN